MDDIYSFQKDIKTRKDFETFLRMLLEDFQRNKENWANNTLSSYLDGLYGYNFDSEADENSPSWGEVAEMLLAAIVYE